MVFPFFWRILCLISKIKLSTHGSNLNFIFVIMSELELFLLTGVLTQHFNIVSLVTFLGKNKKLHV
jgi:hypothetical protein